MPLWCVITLWRDILCYQSASLLLWVYVVKRVICPHSGDVVHLMIRDRSCYEWYIYQTFAQSNFSVLSTKLFWGNIKMFVFSILSCAGKWNPASWKTRTCLLCVLNTIAADDLATQAARVSAAMALTVYEKQGHSLSQGRISSTLPSQCSEMIKMQIYFGGFLKTIQDVKS